MRKKEGKKKMAADPELARVVKKVRHGWMLSETGGAQLVLQPSWEHILTRTDARAGGPGMRKSGRRVALPRLDSESEWDKLAGPCARCGRYYLKKRASQKVYCSRRCGNATTADARTRERLAREHADKLRRSQAAMQKWTTTRTKDDWKVFVSKREPDITPKFLTRAVNKGELKPPTKGKSREHLSL